MKKVKITTGLLVIVAFFLSVNKIKANNVIFSDDFNDSDFSDWTVQRSMQWSNNNLPCMNNGEEAQWEIVNGELGITIDGPGCVTEITPNNIDLSNTKSFEYEFDWDFKESIHMDRNVVFIWQNTSNWYDLKILDNKIILQKVVNGSVYQLEGNYSTYNFSPNNIYRFKISIDDDLIKVFINENQVMSVVDSNPNISGFKTIGLQASSGAIRRSVSYFDNIIVRSLDPVDGVQLDVPLFKQSDPQWKDNTYDHATDWSSKPTIGRWGCALSSMAMILNYHGINQLPDSQPLTPDTLNTWLINQPDGYIGEGALNWMAATRLTRLTSENFGTNKLEYARDNNQSIDKSKSEIDQNKPTILQIDGHFLVANGYTSDGSDLYIKDPAYIYEKFSQHNENIISTRIFTPSQTDLSYIVLAFKPNLGITLYDPDGNIMDLDQFTEIITDPVDNSGESTPLYKYIQLPKPNSGQYKVEVSQNDFKPFELTIWTYDDQANLSNLTQSGLVGTNPISFIINYDKYGPSSITRTINFAQFRQALLQMYESKNLKKFYAYRKIDRIAKYGELAPTIIKGRFLPYLQTLLDHYQPKMTEYGYQYVVQELQTISN